MSPSRRRKSPAKKINYVSLYIKQRDATWNGPTPLSPQERIIFLCIHKRTQHAKECSILFQTDFFLAWQGFGQVKDAVEERAYCAGSATENMLPSSRPP